jgi:hypothetical protein
LRLLDRGNALKDPARLKAACDAVIKDPALAPRLAGGVMTTYCNVGAIRVANARGCRELDGLMADDQYKVMAANALGTWRKAASGAEASLWAQQGGLAFAAMTGKMLGEEHGHIAAIYPAPMQMSGSLGHPVPIVANVGKTNAQEKESLAFPVAKGEPDYFIHLE